MKPRREDRDGRVAKWRAVCRNESVARAEKARYLSPCGKEGWSVRGYAWSIVRANPSPDRMPVDAIPTSPQGRGEHTAVLETSLLTSQMDWLRFAHNDGPAPARLSHPTALFRRVSSSKNPHLSCNQAFARGGEPGNLARVAAGVGGVRGLGSGIVGWWISGPDRRRNERQAEQSAGVKRLAGGASGFGSVPALAETMGAKRVQGRR